MINFILKNPNLYRLYQKMVRGKHDEYDFFKFIFEKKIFKNIRMLDICCGDSFILDYIGDFVDDYLGVDNNPKYLKQCKQKWKNFNFLNLDLNNKENISELVKFKPNFIFINGAIHHLDDKTVKSINTLIENDFPKSYFLSVDPVKHKNGLLNNLMIKMDRGKFIRKKEQYLDLMKSYNSFITNDFYKMNFQNIFHYKNFNLEMHYQDWKSQI